MIADRFQKMTSQHELRVLVVTPTGRDGPLICNLLSSKGIVCVHFQTAEAARIDLNAAAGAVIGGATGAIAGATAASRPGYYFAQGNCYYRYPNGQYVQADPRACY